MEARYGRQTPTTSMVLPYDKSLGDEAVEIYNKTGKTAFPWQELIMSDMMAVNENGDWVHQKFGYSVPRRNGKNECIVMRELWGLEHAQRICHTAHRTSTSTMAFNRLVRNLKEIGYVEKIRVKVEDLNDGEFKSTNQKGQEKIEFPNGGTADFRTRTGSGGLGEGFDLLVIDEAQEYTSEQETALIYTVSDSENPQTVFCGTPLTMVSAGTVFPKMREDCLSGTSYASAWEEWSVDHDPKDISDVDLWYETNPSLGYKLKEHIISSEMNVNDDAKVLDFKIQRLGFWFSYDIQSVISKNEWLSLKYAHTDALLEHLRGKLFIGIKYTDDSVSLSVAVKTDDGKTFVEAIDNRSVKEGNGWILTFLKNADWSKVVIDGRGRQQLLAEDMKAYGIKRQPILPKVNEVIVANATFEQCLNDGTIAHADQPSLTNVITNCKKRNIGSAGGFGYKANFEDHDISLMDSVILANWICATTKEKKKKRISY